MTTLFHIPEAAPAPFAAAVLATSYYHSLHDRAKVEKELARRGVQGDVLLDHLLVSASATHRYFVHSFDGVALSGYSTKIPPTPELEAWSRQAFSGCPVPLDSILLLSGPARACFPEQVSFRGVGSPALHDAVSATAQSLGRSFEDVARALASAGFEIFEDRIMHESPQKVLAEFEAALASWPNQDTIRWLVELDQGRMIRLRLTAREYHRTVTEFALMCLAWSLAESMRSASVPDHQV